MVLCSSNFARSHAGQRPVATQGDCGAIAREGTLPPGGRIFTGPHLTNGMIATLDLFLTCMQAPTQAQAQPLPRPVRGTHYD